MKDKFDYTSYGYQKACEYLKSIGEWEKASTTGFSTDGWSIVQYANDVWAKRNKDKE